jgi:cytochrome c peroxidase
MLPRRAPAKIIAKGRCGGCYQTRNYTDNLMPNLQGDFYMAHMVNGTIASADGAITRFPLRGVKDTATYLHDGRLLTLEDIAEFFNLVFGTQLSIQEKADLAAFLRTL